MVFNSDELEIIAYLKSWKGEFVSVAEICRRAGGRRKFQQTPNWARLMMSRLVDAGIVEVNDRGNFAYRRTKSSSAPETNTHQREQRARCEEAPEPTVSVPQVVDEDYFPGMEEPYFTSISKEKPASVEVESPAPAIVDEDYFPGMEEPYFTSISKEKPAGVESSAPVIVDEDYFPESEKGATTDEEN